MDSSEVSVNKRDVSFDIAKGIAIYLVVVSHLTAAPILRIPIDFITMPLFFFVAGWFFAKTFTSNNADGRLQLKKKVNRLLVPFLVWSTIALFFNLALALLPVLQGAAPTTVTLSSTLSGGGWAINEIMEIFVHVRSVWFLMVLFLTYCFMLVCRVIARKLKFNSYLLALLIWLCIYCFIPDSDSSSWFGLFKFKWLFPMFLLGCWTRNSCLFKQLMQMVNNHIAIILIVPVVSLMAIFACFQTTLFHIWEAPDVFEWSSWLAALQMLGYYILSLSGVGSLLVISRYLEKTKLAKLLGVAGNYSIDVYVLHMFLVKAYLAFWPSTISAISWDALLTVAIVALAITIVIALLAHKLLDKSHIYRVLMRS